MITIIFSTGRRFEILTSWLTWLIRRFTRSRVSHVAIGTHFHGVPVVLHSTQGGVQITLREVFLHDNKIVEEYVVKPDVGEGIAHAVRYIGARYDYVGLVGYAAVILAWRWFRKKIKNPTASPRALVCSEFVVQLNWKAALPEWNGLDPERTNAEDLRSRCEKEVSFKRV
jgi:hypothetical protein